MRGKDLLRDTAWVVASFIGFTLLGVLLTVVIDVAIVLHRYWEDSPPLAYVIWFVVGVFCATFIYMRGTGDDAESAAGRRAGSRQLAITAAVALVLAALSSLVWSPNAMEPVVPDHRGVTITFLVTVVLCVALARLVVFRAGTAIAPTAGMPLDTPVKRRRLRMPVPALKPVAVGEGEGEPFKPAGVGMTMVFVLGVPVLLFLDASFFLFGLFDVFDRWSDPILTAAMLGGLVFGFAAARWEIARSALLAMHAPLLCGAAFGVFGMLAGGILFALGVPEDWAKFASIIAFWSGFLVGCVAIFGWVVEVYEALTKRAGPGRPESA